ncbi:hypothetical protein A2U01_0106161, partial [Trifolium medium]|nr:hypothetical protein [Trifolium medium]
NSMAWQHQHRVGRGGGLPHSGVLAGVAVLLSLWCYSVL